MSLGELVVGISADTARFQSDMGKAAQIMEKFGSVSRLSAKSVQEAIKGLSDEGVSNILKLQRSFNALNIKSNLQIDVEKNRIISNFNAIKDSGLASANEINRAYKAMQSQLRQFDGVPEKHAHGMNVLSLATVGTILKIQLLYSTVNTLMSKIGEFPTIAVDALESFNTSVIKNAAVITSMGGNVKDIGKAYQENKQYAEAVQNVLVKMDAQTIASYKQLQLMNDAFVNQGVFIDINNQKQLQGYKNIANALATISAGMQNADLQFSQEIRGLMNGEDKPTNMLFRQLKAIDPELKKHMEQWKKIAAETGNAGYVLEKLGPLLVGYAAASGDINSLWATVKSTLETIRDQILRGGLSEGFGRMVKHMQDLSKYLDENKEKIQAFVATGMSRLENLAGVIWKVVEGIGKIAEPLMWATIAAGIYKAASAMTTFGIGLKAIVADMTLATGGINLLIAGAATLGLWMGKTWADNRNFNEYAADLRGKIDTGHDANRMKAGGVKGLGLLSAKLSDDNIREIRKQFPMASTDDIAKMLREGAITLKLVDESYASFNGTVYKVAVDTKRASDILSGNLKNVKIPKAPKGSSEEDDKKEDEYIKVYNKLQDERIALQIKENPYLDERGRKIAEINQKYKDLTKTYKEHSVELERNRNLDIENIDNLESVKFYVEQRKMLEAESSAMGDAFGFKDKLQKNVELNYNTDKLSFDAGLPDWARKPADVKLKYSLTGPESFAVPQSENLGLTEDNARVLKLKEIANAISSIDQKQKFYAISDKAAAEEKIELLKQQKAIYDEEYKKVIGNSANEITARKNVLDEIEKTNEALLKQREIIYSMSVKGGIANGLNEYARSAENLGAQLSNFIKGTFSNLESALTNFVVNGKLNFSDLANSIISDLARIAIRASITGPVAGMFGSMLGSGLLPSYAVGTDYVPYDMVAQIHKGEAIIPAAENKAGAKEVVSSAGDVYINIENKTGTNVTAKSTGTKWDGKRYVKNIILELAATDREFRSAFQGV